MRRLATSLIALTLASPALADTDYSALIAEKGLAAAAAEISSNGALTPADRFALGGVRFLRSVEGVLQARWQSGVTDDMRMLPIFRLPIEENPNPEPFKPAMVSETFARFLIGMGAANKALSGIPDDADFGVTLRFDDIWFDINTNSARDPGESLLDVAGPMLMGWEWAERDPATPGPVVRFDAADAAWLSAYTHVLAGVSEVILAYDPTESIDKVLKTRAQLQALNMTASAAPPFYDDSFGQFADYAYAVIDALDQEPDAEGLKRAHGHFLAMVSENRRFWQLVEAETDNDSEWLPNARQQSAFGIDLPPETGAMWMAVLDEMEATLKGDLLVPYWRLGDEAGINIGRMFTEPARIDLAGWIQGADALPYMEKGRLITGESWGRFEQMMGGQAMLLSLWLN
ncbi:hypothetical protein [Neogemmobacter tilapiae]|uniref:Uncharacterized protein n=1 Tax=Neogemmobacter tilapiae TaxID=875041 RepID=A0A918TL40_9RHOB|nr:hypothetical protein [Gemmobacter tilapiae]GHC52879.1 hypothetical protein GCM10007315_14330 [Gemmobacter tilapiae]